MNEWLKNLTDQIGQLPPGRRLMLGVTAAGSLAFFLWLAAGSGRPEYRALYRGLAEDETARAADALRAENIPYELADGGTSIAVPAGQVYEARIRLAGQGLPRGGASGFELFDRPGFGVTEFVHRVNYLRAVQGELARSIEQLEPVERARVQVAIPERRSVVAARKSRARASVVVKLRPGRELDAGQARAVVHLVASSIEALSPEDVTVVDDSGRLLAPQGDLGNGVRTAGGAPGYQQRVEAELAQQIESILEKTVGPGGVVARVRAEMDWTESETTEETYDPDGQVARSEHRSSEASEDGAGRPAGVPGVAANTPALGGGGGGGGSSSNANRTEETINYEISKTVSRRITPMGRIERLSIAVLVADPVAGEGDGPAAEGAGGDAEGEGAAAWSAEDLDRFEELARQAVGFSERRGDQITVKSAPFRSPTGEFAEEGLLGPELLLLLASVLRVLGLVVGLVVFGRFVVKPMLGSLASAAPSGLPARVSELEARLASAAQGAGEAQLAGGPEVQSAGALPSGARSDEAVQAIRSWLNQG